MGIDLRPSAMVAEPQPLNINDKKEMSKLHEKPLEWIVQNCLQPPAEPEAYLDLRGAPSAWVECINRTHKGHLMLHAFCLASADKSLQELSDLRKEAMSLCSQTGDERGLVWLRNRPSFYINRLIIEPKRVRINCWNWDIKVRLSSLADSFGFTARAIAIVYSSKSLLMSNTDLEGWRTIIKRDIVEDWDARIASETSSIKRLFGIRHDV